MVQKGQTNKAVAKVPVAAETPAEATNTEVTTPVAAETNVETTAEAVNSATETTPASTESTVDPVTGEGEPDPKETKEEPVLPPAVVPNYTDSVATSELERTQKAIDGAVDAPDLDSQANSNGPKVGRTVVREDQEREKIKLGVNAREV